MMLGEVSHIRHSRRFAHSHSRTPGLFFLSPECPSCVRNQTQRKEKLATRTPENLSLRSCSKILQMRNSFARFVEYASSRRDRSAPSFLIDTYTTSASPATSSEPQQQREADRGNERGYRNRNPKNHLKHSCVTGA